MPLFMDRHDIPGATAADIAQAHVKDVAVAGSHGVEFLTYWFDADRGRAFCLARAPAPASMERVHKEAHGLIPNEIITVSEDHVLRFLGTMTGPVDPSGPAGSFRVILFTDLEGSTSLLEDLGQSAFMVLLTEHDLVIRRALVASDGREVKHTGDGIMASFDDVGRALDCALAIQHGFDARAASGGTPALRVRIGIAAGEPVDHNDDLFGSSVNLASRICDAADAGHTLVSDLVHELGVVKGFSLHEVDPRALKGFAERIRIFELASTAAVWATDLVGPSHLRNSQMRRSAR
jgi:class 3 adenylate cyclase